MHRRDPSTDYRSREGPDLLRPGSPPWDTTSLRVGRPGKSRFDRWRYSVSSERIVPHWEAFEMLLDAAGVD